MSRYRRNTNAMEIYAWCLARQMAGVRDPWRIRKHLGHLIPQAHTKRILGTTVLLDEKAVFGHLIGFNPVKPSSQRSSAMTGENLCYVFYHKDEYVIESGYSKSWWFKEKKEAEKDILIDQVYSFAHNVADNLENLIILRISKALKQKLWSSNQIQKASKGSWLPLAKEILNTSQAGFTNLLVPCLGMDKGLDLLIERILNVQSGKDTAVQTDPTSSIE